MPANGNIVREDEKGIYIQHGGYIWRPGSVNGYEHIYDMHDGGLQKNDRVKPDHREGGPIVKIILDDGTVLHWSSEDIHNN